jgi:hypothetical protein
MAVAPDFRLGARFADKRIVRRHRSIRTDADDLAEMVAKVLRLVAVPVVLAERDKQVRIRRLHDPAAEMLTGRERTLLAEDHLHLLEARRFLVPETGARHGGACARTRRFGKTEVDRAVRRIVAIERDIEQAALVARKYLRQARERA